MHRLPSLPNCSNSRLLGGVSGTFLFPVVAAPATATPYTFTKITDLSTPISNQSGSVLPFETETFACRNGLMVCSAALRWRFILLYFLCCRARRFPTISLD